MTKKFSINMSHVILGWSLTNLPCAPIWPVLIFQVPSEGFVIVKPLPEGSLSWVAMPQMSPCNVWSVLTHLT